MRARFAQTDDAVEIARLARVMFESIGMDVGRTSWETDGAIQVRERLDRDLGVFVIEHPSEPKRLIAAAAGTISQRLPTPGNPTGRAGYMQWVCTDAEFRSQGLGRAVVASLLAWYEEHGVPTVELHATAMGEALYRSLGFTDEGPLALRRRS